MLSQALAAEDRTWRCAARLATRTLVGPGGVSHAAKSERSRFLAWVIKHNGRVVSKGLGKILHGDRDVDSVTAGADLCDSACLKKVLHYISAITDGRESPDGWPTMATLTAPSGDDDTATLKTPPLFKTPPGTVSGYAQMHNNSSLGWFLCLNRGRKYFAAFTIEHSEPRECACYPCL